MTSRITFLVIAMFWLTMTYLLWRSEYVGSNPVGSGVPVELVWRKILTAPDNSPLQIWHQNHKAGFCRWASNVGQELATGKIVSDEIPPEGMVRGLSGYQLDLEGNVALDDAPGRMRFEFEVRLSTNHVWQEFNLRFNVAKTLYEIHARASEQNLHLVTEEKQGERFERVLKFTDLQNPQKLMDEFDVPATLGMLGMLSPLSSAQAGRTLSVGLNWKARNDWIAIGHSSVRVYRLEASVLDRYRMLIIVSRVGEILRVELPDGWELINDQLGSL